MENKNMTVIDDIYKKKVSIDEIRKFEDCKKIKLPNSYVKFILETNGGQPSPNCFDIPEAPGKLFAVDLFYGIDVKSSYGDLENAMDLFQGRIPESFIPIGDDPGGNILCLGIVTPYVGKIYIWDHHDELDRRGLSKMDMSNMYWVADDIYELINKLRSEKY